MLPAIIAPATETLAGSRPPTAAPVLELFGCLARLPRSYFVHLAHDNRNAPLIRVGEVIVIDQGGTRQGGWHPTDGGLFLIEYRSKADESSSQRYPRVSREIVQTYRNQHGDWHAGAMRRGLPTNGIFYCSDGPYRDEQTLADKLIGKVVGLYQPMLAGRTVQ